MTPFRRQMLVIALKLFDLISLGLSLFVTKAALECQLHGGSLGDLLKMPLTVVNVAQFLGLLFLWHLLFDYFGIYQSRRLSAWRGLWVDIICATTIGSTLLVVISLCFNLTDVNGYFVPIFWFIYLSIVLSFRAVLCCTLKYLRISGHNLRDIIVVGTNRRAISYAQRIERKPELGYRVLGFVDYPHDIRPEFRQTGYRFLADLENFPSVIRDHSVDEVVVTLPLKSFYGQSAEIVSLCEAQGIVVRFFTDVFEMKIAKAKTEMFDAETMITIYTGGMQGWPVVVKRLMDFVLASVLLLLFSPVLLVTALLIKIDSPGPVFFVQERVGLNKRRFRMCKFRTMYQTSENRQAELEKLNEMDGPVFKIKNDPRITGVGRFLRKTSIDELPQLLNVINGSISLVGPRPLPVRDYLGFDRDFHRRRFSVRPGITCLWQVSGRNNTTFEKWMELDMEYIDNWSLWLDLKILAKTLPAVIRGAGAS